MKKPVATVTLELDVDLTAPEIKERGELLAKTENESAKLTEERTAARQMFNTKIKEKETDITRLALDIERKKELRKVPCEIQFDVAANTKKYVRLDTKEVVREETMTLAEIEHARQGNMFPEAASTSTDGVKSEDAAATPAEACVVCRVVEIGGNLKCGDGQLRCKKHAEEYVDKKLDEEAPPVVEDEKPKRKPRKLAAVEGN
jgi:hypothetical protein